MTASARQREWKVISVTLDTNQNASAMGKTIEFTQVVDRCCGLDVHKKVIVATAHELLTIVYHSWRFRSFAANLDADMLTRGANDPEAGFFWDTKPVNEIGPDDREAMTVATSTRIMPQVPPRRLLFFCLPTNIECLTEPPQMGIHI